MPMSDVTGFAAPFDAFVAPARARAEIWRTCLGIVLILACAAVVIVIAFFALQMVIGRAAADQVLRQLQSGDGPYGILVLLSLFAAFWPAVWVVLRLVHRRRFRTLFGPQGFVLGHFLWGLAIILGFAVAIFAVTAPFFPIERGLEFSVWIRLVPAGLILIFLQSTAEELLFRGYLQQQLAARFRSPLVWMLLPSLLFGLGHASGEYGSNNILVIAVLTLSGLIAADVTRRTGALSLAMGLHVGNNILAILILGYALPEGSASLWVDPTPFSDIPAIRANLVLSAAVMIATYLVVLRLAPHVIGRKNSATGPGQG